MICRNCEGEITGIFYKCSDCGVTLHLECANECRTCNNHLCDVCSLKEPKFICKSCDDVSSISVEFLSSTMFESFDKCPNKFQHEYIIDSIPEEHRGNKYSVSGVLQHDIFEKESLKRPLIDETSLLKQVHNGFEEMSDDLFADKYDKADFRSRALVSVGNWLEHEKKQQVPLFTEHQMFCNLDDNLPKIRATSDRINGEEEKSETWDVIDYKTGKVYDSKMLRNNMQLPINAMVIKHIYGEYPKSLQLWFPQHLDKEGNIQKRIFNLISDGIYECKVKRGGTYQFVIAEILERMKVTYSKIQEGKFDMNVSNQHFCTNFCKVKELGLCTGLLRW